MDDAWVLWGSSGPPPRPRQEWVHWVMGHQWHMEAQGSRGWAQRLGHACQEGAHKHAEAEVHMEKAALKDASAACDLQKPVNRHQTPMEAGGPVGEWGDPWP